MSQFSANGKLMLTGEYFVLDGANALAFPTKKGQRLEFNSSNAKLAEQSLCQVIWKSLDQKGNVWFETNINCQTLISTNQNEVGKKLEQILIKARELNPSFLKEGGDVSISSDFNLQWGFGSSSTLISLIAQWAKIDAYQLQFSCFGGSGYDIACATAKGPVLYNKQPVPRAKEVIVNFSFANNLYLVYLGKKQNSREGINYYRSLDMEKKTDIIGRLDRITNNIVRAENLVEFMQMLKKHESIISQATRMEPVQELLFSDFKGQVKSLGAWGGDFILAATSLEFKEVKKYFKNKGLDVVLKWNDVIV